MALFRYGEFDMDVTSLVPQEVSIDNEYRWAVQERFNLGPVRQWVGIGDEVINLKGVIFPFFRASGQVNSNPNGGYVGHQQLANLHQIGEKGEPQMLIAASGYILGRYCLLSIKETRENLLDNSTPRKQTFTVELGIYRDDYATP